MSCSVICEVFDVACQISITEVLPLPVERILPNKHLILQKVEREFPRQLSSLCYQQNIWGFIDDINHSFLH